MRLDASYLHFISQQQLRVLTAIQLGMRNHEWVPVQVVVKLSRLRGGQSYKILRKLLKNKFVVHTGKKYDGYKLAYLGYDYLALQTFIKRGILKDVVCKIGVGKQSDIWKCITPEGEHVVLKLTRLGRNSFRSVKKNREYIGGRTNYNWLYLSRLSSIRQFLFMQLLYQNNFVTPKPIDTNRHAIVMSLVQGQSLCHIQRISTQQQIKSMFQSARLMLIKFAQHGLIHGDFNQFNLITSQSGDKLTVIDFPQCISVNHPNAQQYFNRDVECIYKYFDKMVQRQMSEKIQQNHEQQQQQGNMQKHPQIRQKFILNVPDYPMPVLKQIQPIKRLDREIKTKGHITLTQEKQLEDVLREEREMMFKEGYKEGEYEYQNDGSYQGEEDQENQGEQEQGSSQENQQQEEQIEFSPQDQSLHNGEIKKMSFDLQQGQQLEKIQSVNKVKQVYDNQLQLLMSELTHTNLRQSNNIDQPQQQQLQPQPQQQQQPQRPEFKGLTAFQIRLKIKQQKRLLRQKRKQQMTEDEYIKNAVKRSVNSKKQNHMSKGNKGMKKKTKMNQMAIRQGREY